MGIDPLVNAPAGGVPLSNQELTLITPIPVSLGDTISNAGQTFSSSFPAPSSPQLPPWDISLISNLKAVNEGQTDITVAQQVMTAGNVSFSTSQLSAFVSNFADFQNQLNQLLLDSQHWPATFNNAQASVTSSYNNLISDFTANNNAPANLKAATDNQATAQATYNTDAAAQVAAQAAYDTNGTQANLNALNAATNLANSDYAALQGANQALTYAQNISNNGTSIVNNDYVSLSNTINSSNGSLSQINSQRSGPSIPSIPLLPGVGSVVSLDKNGNVASVGSLSSLIGSTFSSPPTPTDVFASYDFLDLTAALHAQGTLLNIFTTNYRSDVKSLLDSQKPNQSGGILPKSFVEKKQKPEVSQQGSTGPLQLGGAVSSDATLLAATGNLATVTSSINIPNDFGSLDPAKKKLQLTVFGALESSGVQAGVSAAQTLGNEVEGVPTNSPAGAAVVGAAVGHQINNVVNTDALKLVANAQLKKDLGTVASTGQIAAVANAVTPHLNLALLGVGLNLLEKSLGITNLSNQVLSSVEGLTPSEKLIVSSQAQAQIQAQAQVQETVPAGAPATNPVAAPETSAVTTAAVNEPTQSNPAVLASLFSTESIKEFIVNQIGQDTKNLSQIVDEAAKKDQLERAVQNSLNVHNDLAFSINQAQINTPKLVLNQTGPTQTVDVHTQISDHLDNLLADLGPVKAQVVKQSILNTIQDTTKQIGNQIATIKQNAIDLNINNEQDTINNYLAKVSQPLGISQHISTGIGDMAINTTSSLRGAMGAHMSGDTLGVSSPV